MRFEARHREKAGAARRWWTDVACPGLGVASPRAPWLACGSRSGPEWKRLTRSSSMPAGLAVLWARTLLVAPPGCRAVAASPSWDEDVPVARMKGGAWA